MATMTVRSTYSLDQPTAQAIRELSVAWNTSQAEVIRRSVQAAKEKAAAEKPRMTPAELIAHYRSQPQTMTRAEMERVAAKLRRDRHAASEARADKLDREYKRVQRVLAKREAKAS